MAISYWRKRDRYYRLIGSSCNDCNSLFFPPVHGCRKCHSTNIKDEEMSMEGKLITYTILHESMEGFEKQIPMIIGLIELDNRVKVVGQIVDSSPSDVSDGSKVSVVFRKVGTDGPSGPIFYGYKFVIQV